MFQWLLCALEKQNETLPRHIVFCKTIRDCAKQYTMIKLCLPACMEYVQMLHLCTPKAVKDLIIEDMKSEGMFRILICTNVAGMGVNFHELREYALNDKRCRTDVLLTNYTLVNHASVVSHSCCDICVCNCGSIDCSSERFMRLAHRFTKEDSDTDDTDSGDCMEGACDVHLKPDATPIKSSKE
ncbi:hypothetical protein MAR_036827 [Mya arenaria]|uniref:Helicase C-terminal domain-containing protein n=1 Tax=Mya arenaria TaxID=6604 RepID=A0ABY7FLR1_MYAAR|nr:hypothetical protein MAR_036827 [Mya arenaria]